MRRGSGMGFPVEWSYESTGSAGQLIRDLDRDDHNGGGDEHLLDVHWISLSRNDDRKHCGKLVEVYLFFHNW
jgi:hypothetical protein